MSLTSYLREWRGFIPENQINARAMLDFIHEAWTPERKLEVAKKAETQGYHLVDHVKLGDYDLSLWRNDTARNNGGVGYFAVAVNSGQANPFSSTDQLSNPEPGPFPFKAVASTIQKWMEQYGDIVVGSYDPEKTKKYMAILKRSGYRFVPFVGNDFRYGAIVSSKTIKEESEALIEHLLRDIP